MGKALVQASTGLTDDQLKSTNNWLKKNNAEMKQSAALSDKIYQTDLKEREQVKNRAKIQAEISKLLLKSREIEYEDPEQAIKYLKQAQKLEDELLRTDLEIAEARRDIQIEKNSYARSNTENLNAEAELIAQVSNIEKTRADQQASTQRRINTLQQRNLANYKAIRKEQEKGFKDEKPLVGIAQGKPVEIPTVLKLESDKLEKFIEDTSKSAEIEIKINEDAARATQARAEAISSAVSQAFDSLGNNIVDSLGLAENGLEGFLGSMANTAMQLISMLLSETLANAILGATQSGTSTGPAAVFTTPAFIATAVSGVLSAFAAIPKFEWGGIVDGSSWTGDKLLARVNSGEMILNKSQQANLFDALNKGIETGGEVKFKIDGTSLVGVLDKINRKNKVIR